ncbi:hypothetical protein JG687_00015236 [Phytophthora cactorum]|uniref:Uncharacterized protein n=1 Tax=Phytophthora cactorum TaxID=29920 RepID=A0A8T1TVI2_9STRA|nr:hypothetical protein PC120_g3427 [Phytophthora cactorum]KAG3096036.1 hypothetical protein PC121_g2619 [Phytophthora cactorum]KAG4061106.1 hypothetical protein PC123_g3997 [Phytophthora cactorum]KAG6948832.1 hypothetical protein JG687_00015236 [Phytophthora cactorum]
MIKLEDIPHEKDSVLHLGGIGKTKASLLNKDGVNTIGDLRKCVKSSKTNNLRPKGPIMDATMPLTFVGDRDEAKQQCVIESIPLYVWGPVLDSCYMASGARC